MEAADRERLTHSWKLNNPTRICADFCLVFMVFNHSGERGETLSWIFPLGKECGDLPRGCSCVEGTTGHCLLWSPAPQLLGCTAYKHFYLCVLEPLSWRRKPLHRPGFLIHRVHLNSLFQTARRCWGRQEVQIRGHSLNLALFYFNVNQVT